jgi:hypothetical protein
MSVTETPGASALRELLHIRSLSGLRRRLGRIDQTERRIIDRVADASPFRGAVHLGTHAFTQRVLDALESGITILAEGSDPLYLHVESVELGTSPLIEEVRARFRVSGDPPERPTVPRWWPAGPNRLRLTPEPDDRALGGSAVFNFTFRSTMSLQENLAVLGEFVLKHGASTDQFPVPEGRYGADTRRE